LASRPGVSVPVGATVGIRLSTRSGCPGDRHRHEWRRGNRHAPLWKNTLHCGGFVRGDVLIMKGLLIYRLPGAGHSPNHRRISEYSDGPAANKMHPGAFWRGSVDGANPIEASMASHGFQKCLGEARVWTTPSSPVNPRSGAAARTRRTPSALACRILQPSNSESTPAPGTGAELVLGAVSKLAAKFPGRRNPPGRHGGLRSVG
jgi:hypothetical protein